MTVSAADYLVGNRVYNGGTNNPTSGTVDPTGYINRGISQSRSGLAAIALRRLGIGSTNGQTVPNPNIQPNSLPSTDQSQTTLQTSPTGRLVLTPAVQQPVVQPANNPTSPSNVLPFDDAVGQQQVTATGSYNNQLDAINAARNILQNKIATEEHTLADSAPGLYRKLLDNYAAHGMAYSSGYGYSYGQQQDAIANQRAALEQQLQEGLAGYDQQQQTASDNYNQLLAQLATQEAAASASSGTDNMLAGNVNTKPTPTTIKPTTTTIKAVVAKPVAKKVTTAKLTPAKTKAVAKKIVAKKPPVKPIIKPKAK